MLAQPTPWYRSTVGPAVVGAVLLWAALPPLDAWLLAWVAPVPWIMLIRRGQLAGRRPYASLYLVGFGFWLAALHWLRLPHWTTCIGWVSLSAYLGVYLPLFVGLSRVGVHRMGVPVIVSAPLVFAGLELARAHVLTGFRMAALGHTQYRWIELIQVSDLAGDYAVDFIVMLVAACLGRMVPCEGRRRAWWPLLPAGAVLAAAVGYGTLRTAGHGDGPDFRGQHGLARSEQPPIGRENGTVPLASERLPPTVRVALIQGSIDTELKFDPRREGEVHAHYIELTRRAVRQYHRPEQGQELDLVVWPETMVRDMLTTFDRDARMPDDWTGSPAEFVRALEHAAQESQAKIEQMAGIFRVPMILGVDTEHYGVDRPYRYNSAVQFDAGGRIVARYDKQHPVMFGEYTPFIRVFPWLRHFSPLSGSLDSGAGPVAFSLGNVRLAQSICYENVLSHLIRAQVTALARAGQEPQVLVNLTNDGWFWGSSELDMHLTCGVFRAIECRKPMLIAANTGFSAWIDADGRILQKGKRRAPDTLLAEVRIDRRYSPYLRYGDLPGAACLLVCTLLAGAGIAGRFRHPQVIDK